MNWLARLKKGEGVNLDATNATNPSNVAFVASVPEHLHETAKTAEASSESKGNWVARLKTPNSVDLDATNATEPSNVAFVASAPGHFPETPRTNDASGEPARTWLARLKTQDSANLDATNATDPSNVAFVASIPEHLSKITGAADVVNGATSGLAKSEPLPRHVISTLQTSAATMSEFRAAFESLDRTIDVVGVMADTDRWCWPQSTAMNGQEIEFFTRRLKQLTGRRLQLIDAEALADKLVKRDREKDDRRLCLECTHLCGQPGSWRCSNALQANISVDAVDTSLSATLVLTLQRCGGFKN